jgi:hypothetical protein
MAGAAAPLNWKSQKHTGSILAATITASSVLGYDFTNHQWDDHYGKWAWTSAYSFPLTNTQSDVAVGVPFRKFGNRIIVRCRIKVNNDALFDSAKLFLCDASADNAATALSADFKAAVADDAWQEATLTVIGTTLGTWTDNLRVGVEMIGKTNGAAATYFEIDWLSVEQWAI